MLHMKTRIKAKVFFSIKEIEIKGVINSDREEIVKKLGNLKKKFNFFLKTKDFEKNIKKINYINSLKVKKIYPNKIVITIIEDLPIGIYLNENGEKYILLENNKNIKKNHDKFENLPEVQGVGALEKFSDFYSKIKKQV